MGWKERITWCRVFLKERRRPWIDNLRKLTVHYLRMCGQATFAFGGSVQTVDSGKQKEGKK